MMRENYIGPPDSDKLIMGHESGHEKHSLSSFNTSEIRLKHIPTTDATTLSLCYTHTRGTTTHLRRHRPVYEVSHTHTLA